MVTLLNSFNIGENIIEFKRAESFLAVNLFLQNPRPARKSTFFRIPCGNRDSGLTPVNSDACLQISNHTPTPLYINHASPVSCLWGPAAAGAQIQWVQMAAKFREFTVTFWLQSHLACSFFALQYRGLGFIMSEPCVSTCRQEMAVMCVIIEICDSIAFAPSSSPRVGCVSVAAESHL